MTALIWASGRGHSEVVKHLLAAGANPDAADKVHGGLLLHGSSYYTIVLGGGGGTGRWEP